MIECRIQRYFLYKCVELFYILVYLLVCRISLLSATMSENYFVRGVPIQNKFLLHRVSLTYGLAIFVSIISIIIYILNYALSKAEFMSKQLDQPFPGI